MNAARALSMMHSGNRRGLMGDGRGGDSDAAHIDGTPRTASTCATQVPRHAAADGAVSAGRRRASYMVALTWCFTFFNTVRVLAYLPTVVAIAQRGDSTQHSLWTWLTWVGANVTMAAWLYEHNGARMNRAIAVNVANAGMCLVTTAVILAFRL